MNEEKNKEKISIDLKEYKELLEIKGKYEELKQHPEIKYVYVHETKPYIETPKITWYLKNGLGSDE